MDAQIFLMPTKSFRRTGSLPPVGQILAPFSLPLVIFPQKYILAYSFYKIVQPPKKRQYTSSDTLLKKYLARKLFITQR